MFLLIPGLSATTITFTPYANASPYRNSENSAWPALRNGTGGGLYYEPLDLPASLNSGLVSNYTTLYRISLIFDTSLLSDTLPITGAILVMRGAGSYAQLGAFNASVTGFTSGTPGAIAPSDYQNFADVKFATDIPQTSLVEDGNNTFTFNADGLAAINKTGYTNLMIRMSSDVENNIAGFVWGSDYWNYLNFDSGVTMRPQLIVSYDSGDPWEGYVPDSITGFTPMLINFTDHSYNSPDAWNWSRRNVTGNNITIWFSQVQNPSQWFNYTGNYSIALNSSNADGYNITPELVFVNVSTQSGGTPPTANFTIAKNIVMFPSLVVVNDTSTGIPTSWSWNWEDGRPVAITRNATHQYYLRGMFNISLTVTNDYGASTKYGTVRVIGYQGVSPPECWFTSSRELSFAEYAKVSCQLCKVCE